MHDLRQITRDASGRCHQADGTAVGQQVGVRVRLVGVVQGHAAPAGLEDAEEPLHVGAAVVGEQSDTVAARDAEVTQSAGEAVGPLFELAVGQEGVAVLERDGVGALVGAGLEQRVDYCVDPRQEGPRNWCARTRLPLHVKG